ncbi:pantoate-beta-alanine ligase [Heterostelium album PN500]|uniref:Pantoate--beta-alanine ligase n=1 Tax=Heterostelium pallidum (strain ATCC 26659 / Pp 5 / PN500) TaxID=670386 RepID=D3B8W7_HETP5|nr:pantoate-beta-alanine ligase [Heterostelium album PN500]EFA82485.1 pantoate-beta-alanine ligase [Heterostelium album PN500]|eukprot:XP_020434602.1 pantoate-beta-alanine ligase [Heterostelium album PN500]
MVIICKTIQTLRDEIKLKKKTIRASTGKDEPTVGFVPTMGYLHRGHISLVEQARAANDIVVASIFVNPTQFAPHEDLASYPVDIESDVRLLTAANADILFLPSVAEMYGTDASTFVEVTSMAPVLESVARPGHFRGVATVVTKLLNIVSPDVMYIGQKDAMQCVCLRKMVRDLAFNTLVVVGDTVRESNGLAMSSRNSYLTPEEREEAALIYREMTNMKQHYQTTTRQALADLLKDTLESGCSKMKVDYISLANGDTGIELENDSVIPNGAILSLAVFFHGANRKTRLIDVIILN